MANEKVTSGLAGRSCPYCHVGLEEGEDAHRCEGCGALHHDDCWQEGGGCSVFGCDSSESNSASTAGDSIGDPAPVVTQGQTDSDFTIERRAGGKWSNWKSGRRLLLLAAGAVVVVLLAVAAILLLGGGDDELEANKPAKPTAEQIKKKQRLAKEKANREKERKILLDRKSVV